MEFIIPVKSDGHFFQPVGYRNHVNTQHTLTLDLELTGDSTGSIDSTDKKTFSMQLQDRLIIDRLSDVFISGITTQNTKLNTSAATANFILKINEFNIHTNTNQSGLVSKILIPNNTSTDGVANHKSSKLNYVCTLNPSTITNLSGSITTNDESTLLIDNEYIERVSSRYTVGSPNTGIVVHKPSGAFGGGAYTEHARQYDQTIVAATGTTPYDITGDLGYYAMSTSLTVLLSRGGKHIDETDEDGVPGFAPGDIVYHKQFIGGGPKKFNELTHASTDRSLVNDYNDDGTVDYDHTVSNWTGTEFRSIGQVWEIILDGTTGTNYSTTAKMVKFTQNQDNADEAATACGCTVTYDDKYGQDRGNISRAVGGSSLWLKNPSKATTFRCIIELVIIPRKKD